jgi:hypothetical protein
MDLLRVATAPATLTVTAMSFLIVILVAEVAAVGAPHTGPEGDPVAGATVEAEAMQTATSPVSHAAAMMPIAESRKFDATNPQAKRTFSLPSLLDFAYASPREIQASGDHQVRCEARPNTVA